MRSWAQMVNEVEVAPPICQWPEQLKVEGGLRE
jgi:hypothetical protein